MLTTELDLVAEIFNDDKWNRYGMDDEMISASIKVLMEYMDKIEAMKPLVANPTISKLPSKTTGSDSQDSQQFSGDLDRQMMIYVSFSLEVTRFLN